MPSILIAGYIDQHVNQYLTESKPLQYTLTAVESVLASAAISSLSIMLRPDYWEIPVFITVGGLIHSLWFKYNVDLVNEQSKIEKDLESNDLIINDESLQNDVMIGSVYTA